LNGYLARDVLQNISILGVSEQSAVIRDPNNHEEERTMIAQSELQEYVDEIRRDVCSRCVERPEGGPPCVPLGKPCGIELHLPQLVDSVRQVHSDLIAPYLECNRGHICSTCAYLESDHCPCPMDSLAVLLIEAVEAVDRRRAHRERGRQLTAALPGSDRPDMAAITHAFEQAVATWTGCDWPTVFGRSELNLQDWTAAEAETKAVETAGLEMGNDWQAAAEWLTEVEQRAEKAEAEAALAVTAANAGAWLEAVKHARRAWSLEFNTGRPLRHHPPTWQPLYEVIETTARMRLHPDTRIQIDLPKFPGT
jgi:hypothetical protein